MMSLPQLIEEDIQVFDGALTEFMSKSDAAVTLLLDKAGFVISKVGAVEKFDIVTIGALAANAFAATQAIASLVEEPTFHSLYQQGQSHSLIVLNIDENCLLVVVFKAELS